MSRHEIQIDILADVVADMERGFTTRDVSEDVRLRQAHPELGGHRQYHAFVGGALSEHRVLLGIVEERKATSRGSRWEKRNHADLPLPPQDAAPPVADAGEIDVDLGPQYEGDDTFTARMRRHQSWYRACVLGLPYGTGPTRNAKKRLGNMLTREDGAAGRNFLTEEIARVAQARLREGGGAVEPFRLLHNMLSSQPMCFNLFGPLLRDRELAARLLPALVPDAVREVTRVALEWAPQPANEYLGDRTAFDAFIEYRTIDGGLCALGIETKLTEPFSRRQYDGESYRRWMGLPRAAITWRTDVAERVHAIEHNQLWRDHLLTVALRHHPQSPYAATRLLVIHHPEDHGCVGAFTGYRGLLQDGDFVHSLSLDEIVERWSRLVAESGHASWLERFRSRYLELRLSG